MNYIDAKFKDRDPVETVATVKRILSENGIEIEDYSGNSGIENLYSMHVQVPGGFPGSNGKGVTPEFARASGYAEFMERVQMGLLCNGFPYIETDPELNLHTYAPDKKYMTEDELVENGEWMDWIIKESKEPLTRRMIAKKCMIYGFSDKVLTLPFYSLFEDKYVYIPSGFTARIYTANGCCAGNSKAEAWIHAFSEIMERHNCEKIFTSGKSVPEIPREKLRKFKVVNSILEELEKDGDLDVSVFDYSLGTGFPVVSTRIINKRNHSYHINVAADPVFEIAVQRTLTESFQGRSVAFFDENDHSRILVDFNDMDPLINISNQIRTDDGFCTVDYFANELTCDEKCSDFEDNSSCDNTELLKKMLDRFKKLGKPVYVRNFSYLGFPSYKIIVPGFSETGGYVRFCDRKNSDWFANRTHEAMRNIEAADDILLSDMFIYHGMIHGLKSREMKFSRLAGIPLVNANEEYLAAVHFAYAAMKLNRPDALISWLGTAVGYADDPAEKDYCAALRQYFIFKNRDVPEDKIFLVLKKFYRPDSVERLGKNLDFGGNVFDGMLVRCSRENCAKCFLRDKCRCETVRELYKKVGKKYLGFTDGQNRNEFLDGLPL